MDKTVLVVGGGTGIGKYVIEKLAAQGVRIIAASRNIENAELPENVERIVYDVTGDDDLIIPEELNGLVYCPGSIKLQPFHRFKLEDVQRDFDINVKGAFKVLQKAIPALKKGNGSVVLFSTLAVQLGLPFHASVSASKGAVEGLVRSLAAEYAPNIRFNAIAPSLTDTPMAESLLNNDRKREANAERHPLKRVGLPRDIGSMVVHLLSEDASWITGQVFAVDGGMSAVRT